MVHHLGIHVVVGGFTGPGAGIAADDGGLSDDILKKEIGLGVDVGGVESFLEGGRPEGGGGVDGQRGVVERAVGRGGLGSVGRVVDPGIRGGGRDRYRNRGLVESPVHAEGGVLHKTDYASALVGRSRGGSEEETVGAVGHVFLLLRIPGGKPAYHGCSIGSHQGKVVSSRAKREVGVQVAACIDVVIAVLL